VAKSGSARSALQLEEILASLDVLPIEPPIDAIYVEIRTFLERRGTPIGANDMLIASQALALDMTLVTDNVREFSRVPDLRVENWMC
jgi:tRNA(fMet)-specific endonuclease VapC